MIVTTHAETGMILIAGIVVGYLSCMVVDWVYEHQEKARRSKAVKPNIDPEPLDKVEEEYPRVYDRPKRRTMWD